ncbi:MAG: AGE family epimerase/isomerase, partial [Bacteroidota bacterium]
MPVSNKHLILLFILAGFISACGSGKSTSEKRTETDSLAAVLETSLTEHIVKAWYPLILDIEDGGYLSNFTYDWQRMESQPKMLVSQTRHVWSCAQYADFYNDPTYEQYAQHGIDFLEKHMWDSVYGGFFNLRSKEGGYIDNSFRNEKRAYGNTFAIYGLVAYYQQTGDTAALNLAKKTFLWMDEHSRDNRYGGYMDIMTREGTWMSKAENALITEDPARMAWKDYNSSIHLLEAFTELYKAWPDPLIKRRLEEMLTLVRDTFVDDNGYLLLHFTENWNHVSNRDSSREVILSKAYYDHVSFGHDVETAYLLLEASHALGIEHDTKTLEVAKSLVDHSLATGWDHEYGGFYYEGYYFTGGDSLEVINKEKSWWVQAEGLNALLMMSKIYPGEKKYYEAFLKQWEQI